MVEGARLLSVCTPNKGTEGSNPSLSATYPAKKRTPSDVADLSENRRPQDSLRFLA